jgi:hypothetical protein
VKRRAEIRDFYHPWYAPTKEEIMSGSLRLSPKHGVNPSLLACFACSEDTGVALLGRIRKPIPTPGRPVIHHDDDDFDAKAPRRIRDHTLCARCKEVLASGAVILIEVCGQPPRPAYEGGAGDTLTPDIAESGRTGRMWAIKGDAFARIFTGPRPDKGIVFIDPEAATMIFGAPGEKTGG